MCREAVAEIIASEELMAQLAIPEAHRDLVAESWRRGDPEIYGRFDLAYDGARPAKLLEYNADTPTSLKVKLASEAMMDAEVGEFYGPIRSQFGWHILQVQERRKQDVTDANRESQARQAIYQRKFEQELQNWLREIRDEAFVEFKGEYSDLNANNEDENAS